MSLPDAGLATLLFVTLLLKTSNIIKTSLKIKGILYGKEKPTWDPCTKYTRLTTEIIKIYISFTM